jgi:hypothetical protein
MTRSDSMASPPVGDIWFLKSTREILIQLTNSDGSTVSLVETGDYEFLKVDRLLTGSEKIQKWSIL